MVFVIAQRTEPDQSVIKCFLCSLFFFFFTAQSHFQINLQNSLNLAISKIIIVPTPVL